MPHLTIEYSANLRGALNILAALRAVNDAALSSGLFEPSQVKSRAVELEHFRVGRADSGEAMIHARIHVVAGRSREALRALSNDVVAALADALQAPADLTIQITAEVTEMTADTYAKVVIGA